MIAMCMVISVPAMPETSLFCAEELSQAEKLVTSSTSLSTMYEFCISQKEMTNSYFCYIKSSAKHQYFPKNGKSPPDINKIIILEKQAVLKNNPTRQVLIYSSGGIPLRWVLSGNVQTI